MIASVMANLWSEKGRYKPEDFMPFRKPPQQRQQRPEEAQAILESILSAHQQRVSQRR